MIQIDGKKDVVKVGGSTDQIETELMLAMSVFARLLKKQGLKEEEVISTFADMTIFALKLSDNKEVWNHGKETMIVIPKKVEGNNE